VQFLKPLENSEGEIDLDAMRVEDFAVEFVRQSFASQQLVDFEALARARRKLLQDPAAVMTNHALQNNRMCSSKEVLSIFRCGQRLVGEEEQNHLSNIPTHQSLVLQRRVDCPVNSWNFLIIDESNSSGWAPERIRPLETIVDLLHRFLPMR
jgi:hypothetical protein